MSGCLWCDAGNHAFSASDENMEAFTRQKKVKNKATGQVEIEQRDYHVCGTHSTTFSNEQQAIEMPSSNGE